MSKESNMEPTDTARSWMPFVFSGLASPVRAKEDKDEQAPRIDSRILTDMQSLVQPVSLCAPDTGKAKFWFNLHDRLFGSKELGRHDSTDSSSFFVRTSDETLVLGGATASGREWEVTISTDTGDRHPPHKYTAIVRVGATLHVDLIVYGRPLHVTAIDDAPLVDVRSTTVRYRRRCRQEAQD